MGIMSWLGGPGGWIGDAVKTALTGPLIQGGVDIWKSKIAAGNDQDKMLGDLVGRELAVDQRQRELDAQQKHDEIGKWYEPDKLMAYSVAIYFFKLLVWDKVLGLGTTDGLGTHEDPNAGFAATTANIIVGFYFGKAAITTAAKIITNRWGKK